MELIRGLQSLKSRRSEAVVTIGNFDGVHRGHQAIVQQLVSVAKQKQLASTVMVFEPQPQEYFARQQLDQSLPFRLMPFREKLSTLSELGVDRLLCVQFNQSFAAYSARQFIEQLLVAGLNTRHLVIGDDFRFGAGRAGDYSLLVAEGQRYGFTVERANTYALANNRVSSTRIRQLLLSGDLSEVTTLLGRPYALSGRVCYGRQLGRQLGVPTANILLSEDRRALRGVYAVNVKMVNSEKPSGFEQFRGVANIGVRPTVESMQSQTDGVEQVNVQLEAHLFDFNGLLYRKRLTVELLHKLRKEQRFASLAALTSAIQNDIQQAKAWFK